MICNNNYLADILRVCEIKDLIWVMRFQSPLVYVSYRDKIVKQSCYFVKVCDCEFNKKANRGQFIFIANLCT